MFYPCFTQGFTQGFRKIWILFPLNESLPRTKRCPPKRCFRGSQTRWTSRRWDAQKTPYQRNTTGDSWNLWWLMIGDLIYLVIKVWQKWWFDSDKIKIFLIKLNFKMIIINWILVRCEARFGEISVMGYLQWTFSNKMVKGDVRSVGKWGIHGPFSTNGNENISWGYLRGMSPAIVV